MEIGNSIKPLINEVLFISTLLNNRYYYSIHFGFMDNPSLIHLTLREKILRPISILLTIRSLILHSMYTFVYIKGEE